MGCFFALLDNIDGSIEELCAETLCLLQTSFQTLFVLNASWRRCKGVQQQRNKPGREMVTFLLVANMSLWIIYTLIKGRAEFRPTHIRIFGGWAWTIITHVSESLDLIKCVNLKLSYLLLFFLAFKRCVSNLGFNASGDLLSVSF